jgi:hypothetical protein
MQRDLSGDLRIVVAPEVGWIRLPSGTTIRLSGRPACRKVVAALIERRVNAPGAPIARAELISLACAGSTSNRAKVFRGILKRLRLAGLDEIMIRLHNGFLLNPTIPVTRACADSKDAPVITP